MTESASDHPDWGVGWWLSFDDVIRRWPEAEGLDPELLLEIIDAAAEQCADYVGFSESRKPSVDAFPVSWRLAHLLQIQSLWKAHSAGTGDTIGPDGFAVRVYPMDRTVRALLRPARGVPVVG